MRIVNGVEHRAASTAPVVATIGNYDGVHLGHQAILGRVTADARQRGMPSLLVTFDPHPLAIVAPERRPRLLQSRRQKLEQLEASGLAEVLLVAFDADLAALSGRQFLEDVILARLRLAAVHVGETFRFGRDRGGDLALLRDVGAEHGFIVHGVAPLTLGATPISSSEIRACLARGDVERARAMLGRPFAVAGLVMPGDGRGARLRCPTANLDVENELLPAVGVYVTHALTPQGRFPSMTNVGMRPTFGGERVGVETHLLDFDDDLYHEPVEVQFLARLRDEQRFSGPDELAAQLARDRAAAEVYFRETESHR